MSRVRSASAAGAGGILGVGDGVGLNSTEGDGAVVGSKVGVGPDVGAGLGVALGAGRGVEDGADVAAGVTCPVGLGDAAASGTVASFDEQPPRAPATNNAFTQFRPTTDSLIPLPTLIINAPQPKTVRALSHDAAPPSTKTLHAERREQHKQIYGNCS